MVPRSVSRWPICTLAEADTIDSPSRSFFEMATGRTPFEKKDETFTTQQQREEYYRRTVQGVWYTDYDLPSEIEDLCRAIVQIDPRKRIDVPRILAHRFFRSARDGHVDELVSLHEGQWSRVDEGSLSRSECRSSDTASPGFPSESADQSALISPSEVEISATCQQAHPFLDFDSVLPVDNSLGPEIQSTVPFPVSPSLEQFGASFDSDLVDSDAPWLGYPHSDKTIPSISTTVEDHISLRPSTNSSAIFDHTTLAREAGAHIAESQAWTYHAVPLPQGSTIDAGYPADHLQQRNTGIPRIHPSKPEDANGQASQTFRVHATPSRLHSRPGEPTPSRFRSSAAEYTSETPLQTRTSGVDCISPVKYIGSMATASAQRSLLPLPTRSGRTPRPVMASDPAQPLLAQTLRSKKRAISASIGQHQPIQQPVSSRKEVLDGVSGLPHCSSISEAEESYKRQSHTSANTRTPESPMDHAQLNIWTSSRLEKLQGQRPKARTFVERGVSTDTTLSSPAIVSSAVVSDCHTSSVTPQKMLGQHKLLGRLDKIDALIQELTHLSSETREWFRLEGFSGAALREGDDQPQLTARQVESGSQGCDGATSVSQNAGEAGCARTAEKHRFGNNCQRQGCKYRRELCYSDGISRQAK